MNDDQRSRLAELDREMRQALEPVTRAACAWMASRPPKITVTLPGGMLSVEHDPLPADLVAMRDSVMQHYQRKAAEVMSPPMIGA